MSADRFLARRLFLFAGLGCAMASAPASAAVRVIRGSRSDDQSEPGSNGGRSSRIVRPGQKSRNHGNPELREMLRGSPTRSVLLDHAHTGEQLDLDYWRDGALFEDSRPVYRWFLRDWREAKPSPLSVALLDAIWAIQLSLADQGVVPALRVLSAFRTKQTNDTLSQSGITGVARDSFHLRGMAMDIHCPGRSYKALETACLALAPGGVGLYRRAGFVHIDSGPSRRWAG